MEPICNATLLFAILSCSQAARKSAVFAGARAIYTQFKELRKRTVATLEKSEDAVRNRPRASGAIRRAATRSWILLIAGALLAPIWTVRFPPIVDYPNHLASAFVLAHLHDPSFHFSTFYAADWNANPYLAMDVILLCLQRFMPVEIAGRMLLSLCVLAVPAAAWFFVRRANPRQQSLALWSLAITQNLYFFLWGMLNLQLSLALCLLVLGVWLKYLERPRAALWCLLLVMNTALYFTHLMGFGIAGWVMTAYAIFCPAAPSRHFFLLDSFRSRSAFSFCTPPCPRRNPAGLTCSSGQPKYPACWWP